MSKITNKILLKCPHCGKESEVPSVIINRMKAYLTRLNEEPTKKDIDLDYIIENIFREG